jgi:hypothetical protein
MARPDSGFLEAGFVDEVLVVNNNAEQGTAAEVDRPEARQVFRQSGLVSDFVPKGSSAPPGGSSGGLSERRAFAGSAPTQRGARRTLRLAAARRAANAGTVDDDHRQRNQTGKPR